MIKKFSVILTAIAVLFAVVAACNNSANLPDPDETEGTELEKLSLSLVVDHDWVWESRPSITVHAKNPNNQPVSTDVKLVITTDKKAPVTTVTRTIELAKSAEQDIVVTTDEDLPAGFYRATCTLNGQPAQLQMKNGKLSTVVFGISPEKIVSAPDKQPDFDKFWAAAKEQLAKVDMKAELTEITSRSSSDCKVFLVEMQSVPDGPEGDPVTVRGYYLEPQDGKKHPVLVHFFGYDDQKPVSKLSCPYGGSSPVFAEFYLSTRGQIINNRTANLREPDGKGDFVNIYGDWFAYNFGKRDAYYYRGAFMDCVQAIRFMATRPTSDMENVFAEGSSQGGAFSYAAAALSDYPLRAIAPCVAFLGDFPDYFDIVTWPGDTARSNKGTMTDEEMFAFLSYFDTKNLATRISCAVIACSGLQDGTCPPHTNIAPFNNLQSKDKQYYYYPTRQHEIPSDWPGKWEKFFKERIK